jgi:hypothetical protein
MKSYLILGVVHYSYKNIIVDGLQFYQRKIEAVTIDDAIQCYREHVKKIFTLADFGTTIDRIEIKKCKQLGKNREE